MLPGMDFGEPSQELLEWAQKELGEDPETKPQLLQELRDMIYEKGECDPRRTDDAFLLRFLRRKYFKVPAAHRMLVRYYNFKENNPQYYEDVKLAYLKNIGNFSIISAPPYRDGTGRRTIIYRIENWNPATFSITELIQASLVIIELALLEQRSQILGAVCIFDLSGLCLRQAWYMTPSLASTLIEMMVTSFPMRIHAMHIVNQSYMFDMVFNIFKPLLSEAMTENIFFHGSDMESLHKFIDPKYLPERYGGEHPDYNYNDWIDFFKSSKIVKNELKSLGYSDDLLHDEPNAA